MIVPPDYARAAPRGVPRAASRRGGGRSATRASRSWRCAPTASASPPSSRSTRIDVGDTPVFTAHVRDISERKAIDRLKDELVSTVSHELRTPLASMRGFVELMLEREYPPEEQQEFLGIVDRRSSGSAS